MKGLRTSSSKDVILSPLWICSFERLPEVLFNSYPSFLLLNRQRKVIEKKICRYILYIFSILVQIQWSKNRRTYFLISGRPCLIAISTWERKKETKRMANKGFRERTFSARVPSESTSQRTPLYAPPSQPWILCRNPTQLKLLVVYSLASRGYVRSFPYSSS